MKATSRYMQKLFQNDFEDGCEFWTGEDGEPASYVVMRSEEGLALLHERLSEKDIEFDTKKLSPKFAYRGWGNCDWPGSWPPRTKLWMTTDEETPFPVYEYSYY